MINKLTISLLLLLAICGARPTEISANRDTGNQNLQRLRSSRSTEHNSKNHIQNIRTTTGVRLGRGLEQGNHTNVYEGLAVKAEEWEVFMSLSMSTKPAPKPFKPPSRPPPRPLPARQSEPPTPSNAAPRFPPKPTWDVNIHRLPFNWINVGVLSYPIYAWESGRLKRKNICRNRESVELKILYFASTYSKELITGEIVQLKTYWRGTAIISIGVKVIMWLLLLWLYLSLSLVIIWCRCTP